MRRILNVGVLQFANVFSTISRVAALDVSVHDDTLVFVVGEGDLGRSLGRGGVNVRRLREVLKRKIKIVEFNSEITKFIEHFVAPLTVRRVEVSDGIVLITANDYKTRGLLIGRNASELRLLEAVMKRFFPCTEVRIAKDGS